MILFWTNTYLLFFLFFQPGYAIPVHANLNATLYARDTNFQKALYRFSKKESFDGKKRSVYSVYTDLQNKPVLEEKINYNPDGSMNNYWRMQFQINEETKMEKKDNKVHFVKIEKGITEEDSEKWNENTITTEQTLVFIEKNWEKIMNGEELSVRLLVPSRKESVGFTLEKAKEKLPFKGKDALIIEMSATSMIIRAIVPKPILFYFEATPPHKLLMVDGRTPIKKIDSDGEPSDIEALLVFQYANASKEMATGTSKKR